MKSELILPMASYVFYIWLLLLLSFGKRVRAVRSGKVSLRYFRAFSEGEPPEEVIVAGRHYDNQFQVPMLFLIGGTAHLALGQANGLTVALAWAFVATRILHSLIHLGKNKVSHRVLAFALGWLVILLFWGQLAYFALNA